jgi:hypothetical protein
MVASAAPLGLMASASTVSVVYLVNRDEASRTACNSDVRHVPPTRALQVLVIT